MPPATLVLCAIAAVLGTLAVSPVSGDIRIVVDAGLFLFGTLTFTRLARSGSLPLLLVAVLVASAADAFVHAGMAPHLSEQRTARYRGVVLDRTPASDGSTTLVIAFDSGLLVTAHVREAPPPIGSRVVVRGRLTPFDEARNPDEPSERQMQAERGIDAQLQAASVLSVATQASWDPRTWLPRAHEWAHAQLRARLGEPAASVVAGELWGERAALPPDLRSEFQETGTVHVLVTAGLHLGAVAALCCLLLEWLALPRASACALAIAAVWMFVLWSGSQLPATRAATMVSAALAARAFGRATFSWNALASAAIVIAFVRPQSVATASFALSFSCVGAIFACATPLEHRIESWVALPARIREGLVLSISTQIGTWPLTAAVFLQFAPYALLANLAVVPCVTLTMALGAAQLALSWVPPLAQACANINSWPLAWMLGVVQTLAALPAAAIPMTPPPAWCIGAYDAAIVALPLLWQRGARTLAVAALVLSGGLVLWPPRAIDARLRITALDVGQADSIVIQTPRGHTILVDAGGRLERGSSNSGSTAEEVGERIVAPFLLRHGIHTLDAIIISHPHGDHVGGLAPVLRKLRAVEVADSGQRYTGHAYVDGLSVARSERVRIVYPRAGAEWRTDDGVTLHFIGPSLPFIGGTNAINSNSIAFILQFERFRMLFTGDAGTESEQRFLAEHVDLHADVLKVGHHGSAYGSSPAFIAAVHPTYAIISVGRHNLFGHPAVATVRTLQRFGATVYRTDEDGAVIVTSDGALTTVSSQLDP
jgi:competence protein ComEC